MGEFGLFFTPYFTIVCTKSNHRRHCCPMEWISRFSTFLGNSLFAIPPPFRTLPTLTYP